MLSGETSISRRSRHEAKGSSVEMYSMPAGMIIFSARLPRKASVASSVTGLPPSLSGTVTSLSSSVLPMITALPSESTV